MSDFNEAEIRDWRPLSLTEPANATRGGPSRGQLKTWMLVLTARGVPFRFEQGHESPRLLVPADLLPEALAQIRQFERENRNWPPLLPENLPLHDNTLQTLCILLLLASFHNLVQVDLGSPFPSPATWLNRGDATAGLIAAGEVWRAVTALTLHAGWQHLAGNLVFGSLFVIRLARELGSGLAWSLLILAGAGGNLVNALLQYPDHRSIGSSTALFGAIGLFATLSLVRYRKPLWRRWPLPVAAACGLLALLGVSGEQTDLGAHLWGFCCGALLGFPVARRLRTHGRPGPWLNRLLGLAAAGGIVAAWWVALR